MNAFGNANPLGQNNGQTLKVSVIKGLRKCDHLKRVPKLHRVITSGSKYSIQADKNSAQWKKINIIWTCIHRRSHQSEDTKIFVKEKTWRNLMIVHHISDGKSQNSLSWWGCTGFPSGILYEIWVVFWVVIAYLWQRLLNKTWKQWRKCMAQIFTEV